MVVPLEKKMEYLSAQTDKVLLFHSATGKDSIMLLDLCSKYIKHIECVFMFTVPNLIHIEKYINWAIKKYNVQFYQVQHYATGSAIRSGFLGCEQNLKAKKTTLNEINDKMKAFTGINWSVFGFKRSDSMNRNLMMNNLELSSFNVKTKNAYPISDLSNKDVMEYIGQNNLIEPIVYGKGRSTGASPSDPDFLNYCRKYYPQDYQSVLSYFPLAETIQ